MPFTPPFVRPCLRRAFFLALTLFLANCATLHVPHSIPELERSECYSILSDGISIQVKPIVGLESYWDLFDDNLPEIGIAAVWISIHNSRGDAIQVEPRRWHLFLGARRHSLLSPEQVLDRYYEGRKIRMYSVHADRRARQLLDRIGLQRQMLPPAGIAEGLVFMRVESRAGARWNQDARLVVRGVIGTGGSRKEIEIPLYADH